MRRKPITLLIILLLNTGFIFAQENNPTKADNYYYDSFKHILIQELNKFRVQNDLDTLSLDATVLAKAADLSSAEMSEEEHVIEAQALPVVTPKHLKKSGGSNKGEELVIALPLGKGKNLVSPADEVKAILLKWTKGKKEKNILLNPANVYVGIGDVADKNGKRLYISAVFGNYQTYNQGAKKKTELAVPFNNKSKKFLAADARKCKNCDKFKDANALQQSLYVENGKIYLRYDNLKNLKKILKKPTDALAVDIVQKDQYAKADYNILDNNLLNKGVMLKPIGIDKIVKKNMIKPDPKGKKNQKINQVLVEMGKFPEKITGSYELNLMIIQDGYVCKTIVRSYIEKGDQESNTPLEMIPMPESVIARTPPFEPKSESSILNFTIPFEKNKSEFKHEDIKPFIDTLKEPDFIIDGLFIYAYASIEGDSVANAKLQKRRAESVVRVLQGMQKNTISPSIITNDSWGLFQLSMEDGMYDYLTKMGKQEAIKTINSKHSLAEELEPHLAKQRFAQIVMDVTYDISGDKEQKFSEIQFNKAVKAGNIKHAYKIMDYISTKTIAGAYTPEAWDHVQIAAEPKSSGLLMNKVYYDYLAKHKVIDEEQYAELKKIQTLDPTNNIVNFNALYCKTQLDSTVGDPTAQADMQTKIDALYKTEVPKALVDGLNMEWQFKMLDAIDTMPGAEAKFEACVEKIKSFYDYKSGTWQNALKVAFAFSRAKDYKYAAKVLESYVAIDNPDEKLLFSYISIASHVPEKFFSHHFSDALSKAKQKNPDRYCKLFGQPFMSFQVLDNPEIKEEYRKLNCSQ